MITVKSALPTPKEAWKTTSRIVRFIKTVDKIEGQMIISYFISDWERQFNIDTDYFYNDYVLPCIKIYG